MRTKLKLTPVFGNIVIRNICCPGKKRYILKSVDVCAAKTAAQILYSIGLVIPAADGRRKLRCIQELTEIALHFGPC